MTSQRKRGPVTESLAGHPQKKLFSDKDAKLADLFEKLADNDSAIRINAAKYLVIDLFPSNVAEQDNALIEKCVSRLIRGLCSNRKSARYGFFLALSEVTRQIYHSNQDPSFHKLDYLKFISSSTAVEGKSSNQQKRDHLFGGLYACKALLQSEAYIQTENDLQFWNAIIHFISGLARSNPWIREESGVVICDGVKYIATSPGSKKFVKSCLKILDEYQLLKSPEGIAVWLTIQSQFPKFTSYPSHVWAHQTPLHNDNLKELRSVLREQYQEIQKTSDSQTKKLKAGFWQQSLPTAWLILFSSASDHEIYQNLWQYVVCNGLFAHNSSLERKYWGLQLLSKLLPTASEFEIGAMISNANVVTTIIDHLSNSKKPLFPAAKDSLSKLKSAAERIPRTCLITIVALIKPPGTPFFDRITKTKTLEELLSKSDDVYFPIILSHLEQMIRLPSLKNDLDVKESNNIRQAVADILLGGFKLKLKSTAEVTITTPSNWISDTINIFLTYGYCEPKSVQKNINPSPRITTDTRQALISRLNSIFGQLLSFRSSYAAHFSWETIVQLKSMTKKSEPYKLTFEADDAILDIIDESYRIATLLNDDRLNRVKETTLFNEAMILLFCSSLLQAYAGETSAISELQDLNQCYNAFQAKDQTTMHFDLLLELLLGHISKQSAVFKTMSEQVFSVISSHISYDGLNNLFEILQASESSSGQDELFQVQNIMAEEEPIDADSDSSSNSTDESDSDVEVVDQHQHTEIYEGDNNEDDDDDDSDDSDDNIDDESDGENSVNEEDAELLAFNSKLANILQTEALDINNSSTRVRDPGSDTDSSMSDNAMLALDSQISSIFQARHLQASQAKTKRAAKGNVTNFKRRVLDLLLIYVKKEAVSHNVKSLSVLPPVLKCMRETGDESVRTRASDVIKSCIAGGAMRSKKKREDHEYVNDKEQTKLSSEDQEKVWQYFQHVHDELLKSKVKLHASSCSRASLFISRIMVNSDRSCLEKVNEIYQQTLNKVAKRKKRNKQWVGSFFHEWINWTMEVGG